MKIYRWFYVNKLSLNVTKTTSVLFSPINPSFKSINLCSSHIPLSNAAKLLGVLIDKHVIWKDQIHYVLKKDLRLLESSVPSFDLTHENSCRSI